MSSDGSSTTTLRPTVRSPDAFSSSSHPLSNSLSSLSSSRHSSSSSHVSKTYKQASTLFLTRRLPEALSTILPVIQSSTETDGPADPAPVARASRSTRIKVWTLYLTILNAIVELDPDEGKEAFGAQDWRALCSKVRDGEVWVEVVRYGYHGAEGDVDPDVVVNLATLLLAHARTQHLNQKRLEDYLAASLAPNLDLTNRFSDSPNPSGRFHSRHRSPAKRTGGTDTPKDLNTRVKILELYTLHVLPRNEEWDYAREFISMSSILDDERREAFLQALQSLQDERDEAERREEEAQREEEERQRREIEEARRLRAKNEERERKRLEEQRALRDGGGSEVDYGVEKTPSISGSSKGSRTNRASPGTASGPPAISKGGLARPRGKTAATSKPTFGSRATMVMSRLAGLMEHLGASFRTNPMLLMRLLAFVLGLLLVLGQKDIRERARRILKTGWDKIKATAGMGVKVSYI
ncbi:hypothetical protein ACRALDRAFT_2043877 [Sodiomyces alcalophilus JCM 7366]|uniref:uncharacterized protein n=1 Tax=Sodiomyces alcalophilus JCM 7366 TaxID=591952 RepID=UPI0039B53100